MRQVSSTLQSTDEQRDRSVSVADEQHALMRGVIHGVILSLAMWTAALYFVLALR